MASALFLGVLVLYICGAIGQEYVLKIARNEDSKIQDDIDLLYSLGLSGVEVNKDNIEVYVSGEDRNALVGSRFSYEVLKNPSEQIHAEEMAKSEQIMSKRSDNWQYNVYHNYDALSTFLDQTVAEYPTFCRKFSIGESVQGRSLFGIRITKDLAASPNKPEFKYVGNMHGDETVGREILIQLIHLIVTNYNQAGAFAERITKLVDNTDIYIIPSMNPDGFEMGRRSNANFFDLNRNFPDLRFNGRGTSPTQPETTCVMNWIQNHTFVLSANFHGGSVVANYPYDGNQNYRSGAYESTKDDDIFRRLSLIYSNAHSMMKYSSEFANGITNGAQWYVLYGGMQDWNYVQTGCMEITVELSEIKYPNSNNLQMFWEQNQASLIAYMEQVHTGIKGKIIDEQGIAVTTRVTIEVDGRDRPVYSNPQFGSFHRILNTKTGMYKINFKAEGFDDYSQEVEVKMDSPYTVVDMGTITLNRKH